MVENSEIIIGDWVMRIRRPQGRGPFPVLLMLHGWTGDENSMWVFSSRLPSNMLMIAPRGLYSAKNGGYSWHPQINQKWPSLIDFQLTVERILSIISTRYLPEGDFSNLHLIGFSQGTALAYSITILYPEKIASVSGLSGFLPEDASGWLNEYRLQSIPFFVAHGTADTLVPVEKARLSIELLEKAGACVTYCEDEVGHKLSAKCFHGLEAFYKKMNC